MSLSVSRQAFREGSGSHGRGIASEQRDRRSRRDTIDMGLLV